jgi:hypothetical protein
MSPLEVVACEVVLGNRRAAESYLAFKGRSARHKFKKIVCMMRQELDVIDLEEMLPEDSLPEVVEMCA